MSAARGRRTLMFLLFYITVTRVSLLWPKAPMARLCLFGDVFFG